MKKNKWIFAIAIASLGWVACDDDDDGLLDRQTLNDADETFVEVAARSNMAEIEFAQVARTKATDSLVKDFARHMITDHTTAQDELEELADDYAGIEWPKDLDEGHEAILDQLNEAEGHSFDSLYMSTQVQMHEDAVNTFQTAGTGATDARVKSYANKYLPHLEMHLERADSIHTVIIAKEGAQGTDGTGTD